MGDFSCENSPFLLCNISIYIGIVKTHQTLRLYKPLLNLSLIIVIVNLGMPLDYRLIAGAGLFTFIYILSRAIGKIGGAYLGGKLTKAPFVVTKYLGFTLLPHSGVSLVFTGIAVTTLTDIDPSLASIVSGTIVAAAIINEIIAVIVAKFAFKWAGEIKEYHLLLCSSMLLPVASRPAHALFFRIVQR